MIHAPRILRKPCLDTPAQKLNLPGFKDLTRENIDKMFRVPTAAPPPRGEPLHVQTTAADAKPLQLQKPAGVQGTCLRRLA